MKKISTSKCVIGIDEVGRGPLAGPVAVGMVCIFPEHIKTVRKIFPIVKDSKKLSPNARAEWRERIRGAEKSGFLISRVAFVSSSVIDKKGIVFSIHVAISSTLNSFEHDPSVSRVLLDGGLKAPFYYADQKTIVKGDEKELSIALASIVAKVARDARMVSLSKKFPKHGFENHKGYGTRAHYKAINEYGITPHHRKSYLGKLHI
jgi:ribonuclease HII